MLRVLLNLCEERKMKNHLARERAICIFPTVSQSTHTHKKMNTDMQTLIALSARINKQNDAARRTGSPVRLNIQSIQPLWKYEGSAMAVVLATNSFADRLKGKPYLCEGNGVPLCDGEKSAVTVLASLMRNCRAKLRR